MASDFSATWQCLSKRTIVFFVTDQTPCQGRQFFIVRVCFQISFIEIEQEIITFSFL
jgi:hypothetical protein